jgi:hypothetical protein
MNDSIPLYRADGSVCGSVTPQQLNALQAAGLVARLVRHRKGHINRAILHLRPGDPMPLSASALRGTRYAFRERLSCGRKWDLRHLGGSSDARTYAPPETRADFLRVVDDCSSRSVPPERQTPPIPPG